MGVLTGKTVVVTRAMDQSGPFAGMLEGEGARVIEFPTIKTIPTADPAALDACIDVLDSFDYVIFTSVNALVFFLERLREKGGDIGRLSKAGLIAVGPKTAREMEVRGLKPSIVPAEFKAEGVLEALDKEDLQGKRFFYPRAEVAREVLPDELRRRGAEVMVAAAYSTVVPEADPEVIDGLLSGGISAVTFTSSSTVKNFVEMLGGKAVDCLRGVCVACIGPVTAQTCRELGIAVSVMPDEYTVDALFLSLKDYFTKEKRQ